MKTDMMPAATGTHDEKVTQFPYYNTDVSKVVSGPNTHHVGARKIYETQHAIAVVITLLPGEALKKHITPVDVFFYVLEERGVVEIGNENRPWERTCWWKARPGSRTRGPMSPNPCSGFS